MCLLMIIINIKLDIVFDNVVSIYSMWRWGLISRSRLSLLSFQHSTWWVSAMTGELWENFLSTKILMALAPHVKSFQWLYHLVIKWASVGLHVALYVYHTMTISLLARPLTIRDIFKYSFRHRGRRHDLKLLDLEFKTQWGNSRIQND